MIQSVLALALTTSLGCGGTPQPPGAGSVGGCGAPDRGVCRDTSGLAALDGLRVECEGKACVLRPINQELVAIVHGEVAIGVARPMVDEQGEPFLAYQLIPAKPNAGRTAANAREANGCCGTKAKPKAAASSKEGCCPSAAQL